LLASASDCTDKTATGYSKAPCNGVPGTVLKPHRNPYLGNNRCTTNFPSRTTTIQPRPYRSLQKDTPLRRPIQRNGEVAVMPIPGWLHHRYVRI
jgi:hypothetical protein